MAGVSLYIWVGSLRGIFICLSVVINVGDGAIGRRLFINNCSDGDNIGSMFCVCAGLLCIGGVSVWIMGLFCDDGGFSGFLEWMRSLSISVLCVCFVWNIMKSDDGNDNDCITLFDSLFSSICV